MPPVVVALLFAVGAGTWVYTKIMRSTGGNTKNSAITAGIAGIFAFVIMLLILNTVENMLK